MDDKKIDLGKELGKTLKKHIVIILIVAIAFGMFSGYSKKKKYTQKYTATVKIAVIDSNVEKVNSENSTERLSDNAKFDSVLALGSVNLKKVSKDTGISYDYLDSIKNDNLKKDDTIKDGKINSYSEGNVVIINYTSNDQKKTLSIVNSVAENLIKTDAEINGESNLLIIDKPDNVKKSGSLSIRNDVVAGCVAGFILMWVIMLFVDQRRRKINEKG